MSFDEDVKRLTAYSQLANRELKSFLSTACVRIMVTDADATSFQSYATGSLFTVAGLSFLVTAAHIFDARHAVSDHGRRPTRVARTRHPRDHRLSLPGQVLPLQKRRR